MGERGLMGLPGKDAPVSELYRPLEFFGCSKLLDLITPNGPGADGLEETAISYTVLRYSNADLEVSCSGAIGSANSGSGFSHYPAVTVGATDGGCVARGVDYPQATEDLVAGMWVYELKPQPHATYSDAAGHWLNGRSFTFGENDCHAYAADMRGDWQPVSLADVL